MRCFKLASLIAIDLQKVVLLKKFSLRDPFLREHTYTLYSEFLSIFFNFRKNDSIRSLYV